MGGQGSLALTVAPWFSSEERTPPTDTFLKMTLPTGWGILSGVGGKNQGHSLFNRQDREQQKAARYSRPAASDKNNLKK
jgi:hypothetical protein